MFKEFGNTWGKNSKKKKENIAVTVVGLLFIQQTKTLGSLKSGVFQWNFGGISCLNLPMVEATLIQNSL